MTRATTHRKFEMGTVNEMGLDPGEQADLDYWSARSYLERLEALEALRSESYGRFGTRAERLNGTAWQGSARKRKLPPLY